MIMILELLKFVKRSNDIEDPISQSLQLLID